MGIKFIQPEFPAQRRQDPRRNAEARVFDALQRMNLTGHGIYEYRGPTGGTQVDLALWTDMVARIAGTVKGGEQSMDEDGQFFLHTSDGPIKVGSPLQETVDGCITMRHAIRDATKYKHYVIGILFLPDMERNERLEQVAQNHEGVYIIWGLDNLPQDLERLARQAPVHHPPKPGHSENECMKVNRLQYKGTGRPVDSVQQPQGTGENPSADQGPSMELSLESARIRIDHVDTLIVQHYHLEKDENGRVVMPGP